MLLAVVLLAFAHAQGLGWHGILRIQDSLLQWWHTVVPGTNPGMATFGTVPVIFQ